MQHISKMYTFDTHIKSAEVKSPPMFFHPYVLIIYTGIYLHLAHLLSFLLTYLPIGLIIYMISWLGLN